MISLAFQPVGTPAVIYGLPFDRQALGRTETITTRSEDQQEDQSKPAPDNTAVRVALWRALHLLVDPAPHVLDDSVGLALANPDADWRERPDMHPAFKTAGFNADQPAVVTSTALASICRKKRLPPPCAKSRRWRPARHSR
jgi:hypothetical protein